MDLTASHPLVPAWSISTEEYSAFNFYTLLPDTKKLFSTPYASHLQEPELL